MDKQSYKPSPAWNFNVDKTERWAYWDNAFTPEECDKIIKDANQYKLQEGITIGDDPTNKEIRDSKITWLTPDDNNSWVYERLTGIITNINEQYFRFHLFGFSESLQFTRYEAPSNHYDYHVDKVYDGPIRKLSIALQLTNPDEYVGGEFQFKDGMDDETLPKGQGTLLIFPSYSLHRVTPVTEGVRHSLVGWVTGNPFK